MKEAVIAILMRKNDEGKTPADIAYEVFLRTGSKNCQVMQRKIVERLQQIPQQLRTADQEEILKKYKNSNKYS